MVQNLIDNMVPIVSILVLMLIRSGLIKVGDQNSRFVRFLIIITTILVFILIIGTILPQYYKIIPTAFAISMIALLVYLAISHMIKKIKK